jgi:seryl-tRNA synthetase
MLDIKWIRENPEALDRALKNRGAVPEAQKLIALDEARRAVIAKLQEMQERRNAASKEIGAAKAKKDEATAQRLMAEVAALKDELPKLEEESRSADKALDDALALIPNVPLDDVPVGDDTANAKYRDWGKKPARSSAKEHYELGEALGGMDFEAAAKLSGSRFVVLKGQLARMERALGQFMLDLHTTEHGYTEVQPPLLVRSDAMFGTAQLPKFVGDQFYALSSFLADEDKRAFSEVVEHFKEYRKGAETVARHAPEAYQELIDAIENSNIPDKQAQIDFVRLVGSRHGADALELSRLKEMEILEAAAFSTRLWLIPTAEVPLTNLVREQILDNLDHPIRYTALTPCFRSEAGAAGKDTRGMLRQHQFDKVELVSIATPEQSREEHERMLVCAEEVLKRLDLHYRVMVLSTGDMGFAAQKTYDIEVWLPGQGAYREISSCSVCGDFQARRMNARFRPKGEKGTRFVHTLNGSGVAVGRALIAVMENYQNADGSITVPDTLRPYMGGLEKIG